MTILLETVVRSGMATGVPLANVVVLAGAATAKVPEYTSAVSPFAPLRFWSIMFPARSRTSGPTLTAYDPTADWLANVTSNWVPAVP